MCLNLIASNHASPRITEADMTNQCETAMHHKMLFGCERAAHVRCDACGRCYTCDALTTADTKLAATVQAWADANPDAYRRNE